MCQELCIMGKRSFCILLIFTVHINAVCVSYMCNDTQNQSGSITYQEPLRNATHEHHL